MKKIIIATFTIFISLFLAVSPVFAKNDDPCKKLAESKGEGYSCVATSELLGEETTQDSKGNTVHCSCDNGKGSDIMDILKLIVDILTIGIGILGVIGIVWAGTQYLTAAGDPSKVQKAKTRLLEIVIGLAIYVTIYAILRWLLPSFTGIQISMKQLFIVYNPRSSRFSDVKREVLDQIHGIKGHLIGKYEVKNTSIEENIADFSKLLKDGDLVISAGGDATGIISAGSILNSQKDVTLAVLPFGNFNDLSRTLKTKTLSDALNSKNVQKFYPLEIIVNGKFFRYATCYVTIGMTAEAVKIYNSPSVRKTLKSHIGRSIGSYTTLISWYFKNRHKKTFLPEFKLNGKLKPVKTSDYAAINGRYMARVMKGGEDYLKPKTFRSETEKTTNFYYLFKLMAKSILHRVPGADTTGDILEFISPANITIQAEGESENFKNVKTIEIRKGTKCLKVITI